MSTPEVSLRPMLAADYAAVHDLWSRTEGMGLGESDTAAAITAFLARNPGLSAVAVDAAGALVGAVLCGHDGRRGYLHHLAVDGASRGRGLGRRLVERCLAALEREGIAKCNIFVYRDHGSGIEFWRHHGFAEVSWLTLQRPLAAAREAGGPGCKSSC